MSKSATPEWELTEEWAIGRNRRNWILYIKSNNNWRPDGYYATPISLIISFLQKLTLAEPAEASFIEHIHHCLGVAQAAADAFLDVPDSCTLPVNRHRKLTHHRR